MNKTALITGASSGFGYAIALKFAQAGWRLILNGRRTERLESLRAELSGKYNTESLLLAFDVRDRKNVFEAMDSLEGSWKHIDLLVNNAGLALGRDSFEEASLDDWDTMIDTNLKGLLYVSRAALPFLLKSDSPHIINIGSTAAKEVYEKGNVYCATKSGVDSISRAMRIDLLKYKVKVTAIHPGAADTEFSWVRFKGDDKKASSVYEGYEPLHAEDVADVVFYCSNLPSHVCINDLVMTCTSQANSFLVHKG
jgi:3-hydroxy acid dehydrogenase / malonic semialdehyde reductase